MAGRKEVRLGVAHVGTRHPVTLPAERPGMGWGRPAPAPPTLAVTVGLGLEGPGGGQELAAESGEPDVSGSSFPKR